MYYPGEMQSAQVIWRPDRPEYQPTNRHWQGIASMEACAGKLFVVFYSGGVTEQNGNFIVLATSGDGGASFCDPALVVAHADPNMRLFDPNVWLDPLGRLWLFWAQSHDYFDGRCGVWAVRCDAPQRVPLAFTPPRRIANGVMMNKPTVLADGTWLLPCAVWTCCPPAEAHPEVARERVSGVYASTDRGESFAWRGGADVPNRHFDEHMVMQRRDGGLWMLVRRYDGIGEAFSEDGGRTWRGERRADIAGPDSRFFVRRLRSGNLLLVNHVNFRGRDNLKALISLDDGASWTGGLLLDGRDQVSYPDGTQAEDGTIYIAYDFERYRAREILFARFTERDVLAGSPMDGRSRLRNLVSRATGPLPDVT